VLPSQFRAALVISHPATMKAWSPSGLAIPWSRQFPARESTCGTPFMLFAFMLFADLADCDAPDTLVSSEQLQHK
jgi:hypothetical protein